MIRSRFSRSLTGSLAFFALVVAPCASAVPYVSLDGMYLFSAESETRWSAGDEPYSRSNDMDLDSGYGAAVALGLEVAPRIDAELEVGFRSVEVDQLPEGHEDLFFSKGDHFESLSFMTNAIVAVPVDAWPVEPYVGGGAGLVRYDLDRRHDTVWGLQALAGVKFALTDLIDARFGYRLFASEDPSFSDGDVDFDSLSHAVTLGIVHRFGPE